MPKIVKTKSGYNVVSKHTGKVMARYTGKGAYGKAKGRVAKGY